MEQRDIEAMQSMIKVLDLEITRFALINPVIEDIKDVLRAKKDYHDVDQKKFANYLYGKYGKDHPEVKVDYVWKGLLSYAIEDLENENKISQEQDSLASNKQESTT